MTIAEPPDSTSAAANAYGESALKLPIVGVGASAGGLDAFKRFFGAMPPASGAAFVVVPHLDPTHDSLMVELLARHTAMPVHEVRDGMTVSANCIYVIPPNRYLTIDGNVLRLSEPVQRHGDPTAIDYFFRSLAAAQGEYAIGIILSGTSRHGTAGVKEIKLAGGMVMAQQPDSAEYPQMPRSAIDTGLVDFVLPPEEMPNELLKYLAHPYLFGPRELGDTDAAVAQLGRVLSLLRTQTKADFGGYRKRMLQRRVLRRMGLRHIAEPAEYVDFLRDHPDEVTALYRDLLIGVTEFFRTPGAFDVLEQRVIPDLMELASTRAATEAPPLAEHAAIRVWVPGCATGEEAYSIAMLFIERSVAVQMFATDIDPRSVEIARQGIYTETAGVSPDRLQRFFKRLDANRWQVCDPLRQAVTFAPQNLIGDAPFSKLDLISCRNLLIYFEPDVQDQVIRLFHFALADGGYLMLGPSESIGRNADLFEPVSKEWRIFRRLPSARRAPLQIPIASTGKGRRSPARVHDAATPAPKFDEVMERAILADFAPAAALINRERQIVSVLGPLVDYLEFPPGEITRDLLAMTRPGLRTRLRAAIHKAITTGATVTEPDARVLRNGSYARCTITVKQVEPSTATPPLWLVTLRDIPAPLITAPPLGEAVGESGSDLIEHLEREIKSTRGDLQRTIEVSETANEELKASNEEMMSMNEELQSANEELESSKEELQSLNEELNTVNNQLQDKVEELDRSNADLANLIASSAVATIFLDTELRLKRFTPAVAKLLQLRQTDVDHPFRGFALGFRDDTLFDDCRSVLRHRTPIEKEVWADAGHSETARCYLRRVLPYVLGDDQVGGVAVTLIDITERIAAEARSRRLATVLWDSNDAVTVRNSDGRIVAWNRGAERMYGYSEHDALQMNIRDMVPEQKTDETQMLLQRVLLDGSTQKFETQRRTKDGRLLDVEMTATPYRDEHDRPIGIATTERDITERNRLARELERANQTLERRVADQTQEVRLMAKAIANLGEGVVITADDLDWPGPQILFVNDAMCRISGYTAPELIGRTPRILQGEQTDRTALDRIRQDLSENRSTRVEIVNRRKDGTPYDAELYITALFNDAGHRTNFVSIHRDVSERKRAEEALRRERIFVDQLMTTAQTIVLLLDKDGRILQFNRYFETLCGWRLDEARGHDWFHTFLPEPDRDSMRGIFKRALRGGLETRPNENPIVTKDGRLVDVEWYGVPLTDERGEFIGLLCTGQDVTARNLASRALREREERMRAVLDTAGDAIVTIDQRGTILSVNPATERIFGYPSGELLGHNVKVLMPQPYQGLHDEYLARYLQTRERHIIGTRREMTARRKDGSEFAVELAVTEVDHLGIYTGMIRDISARVALQRRVLEISETEQRRIGQELHDGTGQELTGLALIAGALKDLLTKTPKASADAAGIWLLDEADLARMRGIAERLTAGVVQANYHVKQLSHGIMPVQIEPGGLGVALEQLTAETDALNLLSCSFECPAPVTVANMDIATNLYRIAQEAVNNAIRHSHATRVRVSLREDQDALALTISDDGVGIESVRTPAKPDATRGFGIEIMQHRANLIGGKLLLSCPENGGTSVQCVIPARAH